VLEITFFPVDNTNGYEPHTCGLQKKLCHRCDAQLVTENKAIFLNTVVSSQLTSLTICGDSLKFLLRSGKKLIQTNVESTTKCAVNDCLLATKSDHNITINSLHSRPFTLLVYCQSA
jgi:hypothetical protein